MTIRTYSPEKIGVIVAGIPMHGFSENSICTIEYAADAFTMVVGADGEVGRSYNPDRSGTITITLKSDSDSNDVLSGLAIADAISLTGTFPVFVKDSNGTSIATASDAWIQKIPSAEHAREINEREWVIQCANLLLFVGGNV